MISLSVLDLAPIIEGGEAALSFRNTRDLAQHAESWGYARYWLAEHHNMPGIASAATAVVIADVANATKTIRVGAGGVMLPNHSPLVIAEQFGTLAALFPGRIDLGLGRAPGSDQLTARALRRTSGGDAEEFPQDVLELQSYLGRAQPGQPIRAVPGVGSEVPLWILGSSTYGATLAAHLGLPFAFASHFAPAQMSDALASYRRNFRPSAQLAQPHVMLGLNVFAAATDAEARRLFTSLEQAFINLRRGRPTPLPRPVEEVERYHAAMNPTERAMLDAALACAVIGSPDTVQKGLAAFIARTGADELMITSQIHDHAARLRSFEIAAAARDALKKAA